MKLKHGTVMGKDKYTSLEKDIFPRYTAHTCASENVFTKGF